MNIFLDNASTIPLLPQVKEYLISILDEYGNPSSLHSKGIAARQIIETARKNVMKFIGAKTGRLLFVPSGSAANTIMVDTALKASLNKRNFILYSPIAHGSIIKRINSVYTENKKALDINQDGRINIQFLNDMLKKIQKRNMRCWLIIDAANSEIGTIQDFQTITEIVHKYDGFVYLDYTGAVSTIPLNVEKIRADAVSFSGHKIGALKGIGALWYNPNVIEIPSFVSGSQEYSIIGGTENITGIASMGIAVKAYKFHIDVRKKRDYVYNWIKRKVDNVYLVGADFEHRLKGNLNLCFKGISGEALMLLLDAVGVQISTGSACNSGSRTPSNVLQRIKIPEDDIHSCVRMSFSGNETQEELDYVCKHIKICVEKLRLLNE